MTSEPETELLVIGEPCKLGRRIVPGSLVEHSSRDGEGGR